MNHDEIKKALEFTRNAARNFENQEDDAYFNRVVDESKEVIRKYSTGFKILHDEFHVLFHSDSLALIGAQSGNGKTTLANQIAAHAIHNERRVLIIANEMNAKTYRAEVGRLVGVFRNVDLCDGLKFALKNRLLFIEDTVTSEKRSRCYDTLKTFTFDQIELRKPNLVIIDQISEATDVYDPANASLRENERLARAMRDIGDEVNKEQGLPPIIVFQQTLDGNTKSIKPSELDMKSNLRTSRDTYNPATHAIHCIRRIDGDTDITTLVIPKNRYGGKYTSYEKISDWVMNEKKLLVPFASVLTQMKKD